MKKTIEILEIIILLFILYFTWGRLDGKLSSPFFLELSTTRILLNIGISTAVALRVLLLTKMIKPKKITSSKLQLTTLGLYLLMMTPDLFAFIKWNIYAEMNFYISIILLTPVLLGIISMYLKKIKTEIPTMAKKT